MDRFARWLAGPPAPTGRSFGALHASDCQALGLALLQQCADQPSARIGASATPPRQAGR